MVVVDQCVKMVDRWDQTRSVDLVVGQPTPSMAGGPLLWWVAFLCLLDPSCIGAHVEYAFQPDVWVLFASFPE
jgi:hypothetical protein